MNYISSSNPNIYTLTYENQTQKTVEAFNLKFEGKYLKFYNYVGELQEAFKGKKVVHIKRVRKH